MDLLFMLVGHPPPFNESTFQCGLLSAHGSHAMQLHISEPRIEDAVQHLGAMTTGSPSRVASKRLRWVHGKIHLGTFVLAGNYKGVL